MAFIEREKVTEVIRNYGKGAIEDGQATLDPVDDIVLLIKAVDFIPTADVEEVKHGYWTEKHIPLDWCDDDVDIVFECSICKSEEPYKSPRCPECGAKMDIERSGT